MDAPDFTLRQLSYLVTAAEEGTIAAAAARLHVSPSAISDALTDADADAEADAAEYERSTKADPLAGVWRGTTARRANVGFDDMDDDIPF